MKNVTYVTAFLDLHEDRSKDKSFDTCFAHFQYLINEFPFEYHQNNDLVIDYHSDKKKGIHSLNSVL